MTEYLKRYREANPGKFNEYSKRWRKANPEKVSDYNKRFALHSPEKRAAQKKQWAESNPEKVSAKNKRRVSEISDNYAATLLGLPVALCPKKLLDLKRLQVQIKREIKERKKCK